LHASNRRARTESAALCELRTLITVCRHQATASRDGFITTKAVVARQASSAQLRRRRNDALVNGGLSVFQIEKR
jgi:hypothetical protein